MKIKNRRYVFVWFLLFTGALDFFTFAFSKYSQLEINPVYLFTGSIFVLFMLKFLLLFYISYRIIKPKKYWIFQFCIIMVSIYLIVGQSFGAYTNLSVSNNVNEQINEKVRIAEHQNGNEILTNQEITEIEQNHVNSVKIPKKHAQKIYFNFIFVYFLYPVLMALFSFLLWGLLGNYGQKE